MHNPAFGLVGVFLLGILAGCVGPGQRADTEGVSQPSSKGPWNLKETDRIEFSRGIRIDVVGTGWGRLDIAAAQRIELSPYIDNPGLGNFDRGENATTDPADATFALLYANANGTMTQPSMFHRWGIPVPNASVAVAGDRYVWISPDEPGVLVFATNVPGFSISIGAHSHPAPLRQPSTPVYHWTLGPREGFSVAAPAQVDANPAPGGAVNALRQRSWDASFPSQPPSILLYRSWSVFPDEDFRAGLLYDEAGWSGEGKRPAVPGPTNYAGTLRQPTLCNLLCLGREAFVESAVAMSNQTQDVSVWRLQGGTWATQAGADEHGFSVMAVPYQNP